MQPVIQQVETPGQDHAGSPPEGHDMEFQHPALVRALEKSRRPTGTAHSLDLPSWARCHGTKTLDGSEQAAGVLPGEGQGLEAAA
ncbi:MAG TPA: hypothetical protein VII13_01140, partial [Vicinamibacteria bacterium]